MSDRDILFRRKLIGQLLDEFKSKIMERVFAQKADYILNVNEEEYISSVCSEFQIQPLEIQQDSITMESCEEPAAIEEFGRIIHIRRNFIIFSVPFTGEASYFSIQPNPATLPLPSAHINASELRIKIFNESDKKEQIQNDFNRTLTRISANLSSLNAGIDTWNAQLRTFVETTFRQRKTKFLHVQSLSQSLGFPLKKRSDLPASYTVPLVKKKIYISPPVVSSKAYQAHPALDDAQYQDILGIIHNMALVMERSPSSYKAIDEESLRMHFLLNLNGYFEGAASGETFNFEGKTDILIRKDGRNLFIAECKFWSGAKAFGETIDQLLNYLTWRDAKTAILLFVRDTKISTVLDQISGLLASHENFLKVMLGKREGEFAAVMKNKRDPSLSLQLTVQVYDVPKA